MVVANFRNKNKVAAEMRNLTLAIVVLLLTIFGLYQVYLIQEITRENNALDQWADEVAAHNIR